MVIVFMALNKKNRLKKKRDFEDVFKKGKAVNGVFLFVKYKKNKLDVPRFGFVIPVKVARKAVERNKIRRILSEATKTIIDGFGGYDIIVVMTHKIIADNKNGIEDDFLGVLKKI